MDSSLYKRFQVSRGFNYDFFASPAADGKPTILLAHGFPSTSLDWRRQVPSLKAKGFGVIAMDMLGYGGTSKPTDAAHYAHSKLATDLHEIVLSEGVSNVIAIGHDWGSSIVSRLAILYQNESCYIAFGFLAVGYTVPGPKLDYEQFVKIAPIGYWEFFAADDGPSIIKKNMDSFIDLLFPKDPSIWATHIGPRGAARKFIESNSRVERLEAITAKEYDAYKTTFTNNGLNGPVCYYKTLLSDIASDEAKEIPQDSLKINKPVLYVSATKDVVSRPEFFLAPMQQQGLTPDLTYKALDSGHWLMFEKADEVTAEIEAFATKVSGCA